MAEKQPRRPASKSDKPVAAPGYWALSPMVSMVGVAGWIEMVKESSSFAMERYGKDVEAQRQILNCRSPEDMFRLQTDFMKEAVQDYIGEFNRIADIWSRSMTLGFTEATASRARNYDDIPL